MDPLDGTREFTRKQFECVTTLLGISLRGRPVAGLIAEPFRARAGQTGHITWGVVGLGVFGLEPAMLTRPEEAKGKLAVTITHSRITPEVETVVEQLAPAFVFKTGGSGNKALRVLEGHVDGYVNPNYGTKRWDSCAAEALFMAVGGKLTNRYGEVYTYQDGPHDTQHNSLGLMAAVEPAVLDKLIAVSSKLPRDCK